ncbi:tRNA pseudouridine38-40 synthase [Nitrosomonas sp. Nm51]|uniref:tRNA pseudouridine(38-40) synthase TruA n=1 Tax=Nitrosomonas sp. Nm51 TaxID=133720 RepID=UPI0008B9765E|nr:tRNA pseudouridine(38-40) synthase TruA [Nitrosomonas sp. Nm51]SEQ77109.1 tRNA pseudouridine38-40 synthase [Nitrosomonas sp. Nm51]
MRIVLILEYNGSNYCGWQSQPCNCSIQDKLEFALSCIANEKIRVVTAGRTDAGVHALYQVVHFETTVRRPKTAWIRGVNTFLPKDIAVLWASEISGQFHARFSANARRYQYLLLNHPIRPGILYQKAGWCHQPLDLEKMQTAARILLGKHDFSAFRAAECQAKSPVRMLTQLDISRRDNMIMFDLCANAFLHHMVRNIVGCLVYVGKGRYSPDWLRMLLENGDRAAAAPTFSASGLYLADIIYDPEWNLPRMEGHTNITNHYRFS